MTPVGRLSPEVVLRLAERHVLRYEAMRERAHAALRRTGSASPYRLSEIIALLCVWRSVVMARGVVGDIPETPILPTESLHMASTLRAAAIAELHDAACDAGLLDEDGAA